MTIVRPITPQRSAWRQTAVANTVHSELNTNVSADVIIIGAGYTGLNAAIRCNELGKSSVVLEAEEPGFGGSGRNGGQVIPGLKYDPPELLEKFGPVRGRQLIDFAGEAPTQTFKLIERYNMDCDAVQSGWLQPATDTQTDRKIKKRASAWKDAVDLQVTLLNKEAIQKATGSDFFSSGWIDPRGGQLQPLSYARELARVAVDGGSSVFVKSPAQRFRLSGDTWIVECNGFEVQAPRLLVCTNGYSGPFFKNLSRSLIPASSIICATKPLSDNVKGSILPAGLPLSDARRLLNYIRFDTAGRLLIGARGSFSLKEPESYFRRLRETAVKLFPQLAGCDWEASWGGRFALTVDQVPHLYNPEPGLYAAVGCNGRGVAMLSQLGRVLGDLALGMPHGDAPLPVGEPKPIPLHGLRRPGLEAVATWYRALDLLGR